MNTKALVLSMLAHLSPGADRVAQPAVVNAIVEVGGESTMQELALLTVYAWKESLAQVTPKPYSWDARAGVSCGPWQEPCAVVRRLSLADQARYWLRELRTAGLASLDSSAKRAARREAVAAQVLRDAVREFQ